MRARAASALLSTLVAAGPAAGDEAPLSAIDWLSDSVAAPDAPEAAIPPPVVPGTIEIQPLDPKDTSAPAGILPPERTGLPADLWGTASAEDVAARIGAVPGDLLPALRRFFKVILLARTDPPRNDGDDAVFLTRVDRLLELGALDQAAALLDAAGPNTPDRFRRHFDIALLKGDEHRACGLMKIRPDVTPTYPARIFCLARSGDWAAAALTLETAHSLGILTAAEDMLLARFLDPDIVDDLGLPPGPVTPLTFRLEEAVGDPVPTRILPLAFAWSDLRPTQGWKTQIEAAERLARAGALSGARLFALYLRQEPSASGGVWDRVRAVRMLDRALAAGDAARVDQILPDAHRLMADAGLTDPFARSYGVALSRLPLSGPAREIALALGLRSQDAPDVAGQSAPDDARERFILALARGVPETAVAPDALALAIRDGFLTDGPPEPIRPVLAEGRVGEALLRAIGQFQDAASGDVDGLTDAIRTFRHLGFADRARAAALDLLLSGPRR